MEASSSAHTVLLNSEKAQTLAELLQCKVCYNSMGSRIFSCINGHNVCSECEPQLTKCPICRADFSGTRNYLAEELSKCIEYPCENLDAGCQATLTLGKLLKHRATCLYRQYQCFAQDEQECKWRGRYPDIMPHIMESHANSISKSKEILFCDKGYSNISVGHNDFFFIERYDELFIHYYKRVPTSGKMYFVVQYIGSTDCAARYQYKITFSNENKSKQMILKCNTHTDCETVEDLHRLGQCVVLDYSMASQFLRYDDSFQYFLSIVKA